MTDEMKYNALLKEIGELLERKSTEITLLQYRVEDLEEKLKAAEAEREEAMLQACDLAVKLESAEHYAEQLERENKLLRGA